MVLLLVFMQLTRDLFAIAKFLLISVLVFVSRYFELGRVSVQFMLLQLQLHSLGGGGVQRRPSVPYGANFYIIGML